MVDLGTIRMRATGSAGGHNGVQSIIQQLNTQDFARLRIGISRPQAGATVPYVLARFTSDEEARLPEIIDRSTAAAMLWLREGTTVAMNEYNRKPESASTRPEPSVAKPASASQATSPDRSRESTEAT